jgi:hypothetical protein
LIFIFSPLVTARELAAPVVFWATALKAEKPKREIANMREENILLFGIAIKLSP